MLDRRLGWQIEKYILFAIIVLSVFDFFGLVNVFWGYILDLVAWSTVAYVIYVISPTELFFGQRHAASDLLIVLSYVLLYVKDLVGQALVALPKLHASAGELIRYTAGNATQGFTFSVTQAEMNSYQFFSAVPRSVEISQFIAPYFTLTRNTIDVILTDGTKSVALKAFTTTTDGAMLSFYNTIVAYSGIIQTSCIVAGTLLLFIVGVYAALRLEVKTPSILSVLKEEGAPGVGRVFWVFMLFFAFFVMVFNLIFEWMTITNDAPLLVIMLVVVLFLVAAGKTGLDWDEIVTYLGDSSDTFYNETIALLKNNKTILLGVSGFLVLHLLTDIGNFIVPAIVPWFRTVYVNNLGAGHEPLFAMIMAGIAEKTIVWQVIAVISYLLSTTGLVLLLALPGIIWYKIFKLRTTKSHEHLPDWSATSIGIVVGCIVAYVLAPAFTISMIKSGSLVGVDLVSSSLTDKMMLFSVIAAVTAFVICVAVARADGARKALMLLPFGAAVVFFGFYIFAYFSSTFLYYVNMLSSLVNDGHYSVVPTIFLLFGLSVLFFITGFFSFVYEIWRD